jgi:neutral ceramidase
MEAGTATVDITPPKGSRIVCFPSGPNREARRAEGAHDSLEARALVLRDGDQCAAVVSCDLCGIRRIDVERIRTLVRERVPDLIPERVMIACSHSHASAESLYLFGNTPDDPFIHEMNGRIAEAIAEAWADLGPVDAAFGLAPIELNHNRRVLNTEGKCEIAGEYQEGVTAGVVDPELAVLTLAAPGGAIKSVLFRYTAHSLTLGPGNRSFSADYPGRARSEVESAFPGCTSLFLNGAAGNVHPRQCLRDGCAAADAIGRELGRAVVALAKGATPLPDPTLHFAADTLTFPNRVDPDLHVDVEVACLAVGPVMFGFVPGEVFVEFQLEYRRVLEPRYAVFVGYANGWPGYIPTLAAYPEGGYGVDLCTFDPAEYSRTALPPGAGERILERLISLAG